MILLNEFNVFCLRSIKSHPQNTIESRHWKVALCRNGKVKKLSYTCRKGVELDIHTFTAAAAAPAAAAVAGTAVAASAATTAVAASAAPLGHTLGLPRVKLHSSLL